MLSARFVRQWRKNSAANDDGGEKECSKIRCKICFDRAADTVIAECGHIFCCICVKRLNKCGVCRVRIYSTIKIFY